MRSKDDFINQHIFDTEYHINLVDADKAKEAMDEYAKEFMVGFEKWRNDNGYLLYSNKFYANQPPQGGVQTWFTLDELMNKFLQETNKSE